MQISQRKTGFVEQQDQNSIPGLEVEKGEKRSLSEVGIKKTWPDS